MRNYNCQLDNIEESSRLCFEKGESFVRFYSSKEFAALQAGLFFRAYVNETVEVEESFNYEIGCNVAVFADYGNCEREYRITPTPWAVDYVNVAYKLNKEIADYTYGKDCHIGTREYSILENVEQVTYDETDNIFTVTDEEGDSFIFTFHHENFKVVN